MLQILSNVNPVVLLLVGVIAGLVIGYVLLRVTPKDGTLKIDKNDPDVNKYLIEFDDLDDIPKNKFLILKVDANADLQYLERHSRE